MAKLLNRAWMTVSGAPGTGTVTLLAAVSNAYLTFAEAGAANANVYAYVLEDADDFEIGIGTYTSAGTTFSRDTVTVSKEAGTAGAAKITASSISTIFILPRREDLLSITETQTVNTIFAGPASGGAAAPTFRTLAVADLAALGSWTSYSPTVTANTGTITTLGTVTGRSQLLGKTRLFEVDINITTNGTGAGFIRCTLPSTVAAFPYFAFGQELNLTGALLIGHCQASTTNVAITTAAGAYPGGSGARIAISGAYEEA